MTHARRALVALPDAAAAGILCLSNFALDFSN